MDAGDPERHTVFLTGLAQNCGISHSPSFHWLQKIVCPGLPSVDGEVRFTQSRVMVRSGGKEKFKQTDSHFE